MTKFINVRGTNGSGKTTLLLDLAERWGIAHLETVEAERHPKGVAVTVLDGGCALVGNYSTEGRGKTGGLDKIKTQAGSKQAIENTAKLPGVDTVVFEGVMVSTIYRPWQEWSVRNGGMIWAYLDTPVQTCIDRIQARNGGKPIKEWKVHEKIPMLASTFRRAQADGERVETLDHTNALNDLENLINGY